MMPTVHGVYPADELVPLCIMYKSKSGTGNLWGGLTTDMRVFLLPGITGLTMPKLTLLNKKTSVFSTLCDMEGEDDNLAGMVGLGWFKVKKNPLGKTGRESWTLYFSHTYKEKNDPKNKRIPVHLAREHPVYLE